MKEGNMWYANDDGDDEELPLPPDDTSGDDNFSDDDTDEDSPNDNPDLEDDSVSDD